MTTSSISARVKRYMTNNRAPRLSVRQPLVALVDGVNFSKFNKQLERPYDQRLAYAMVDCAKFLLRRTRADCVFTWSDKICLTWSPETATNGYCDGHNNRVVSLLAAGTTVHFHDALSAYQLVWMKSSRPVFAAQIWHVPSRADGANTLLYFARTAQQQQFIDQLAQQKPSDAQVFETRDMMHAAYGSFLTKSSEPDELSDGVRCDHITNPWALKNKIGFVYRRESPVYSSEPVFDNIEG